MTRLHRWDDIAGFTESTAAIAAQAFRSGRADIVWTAPASDLQLAGGGAIRLAVSTTNSQWTTGEDWAPDAEDELGQTAFAGAVGSLAGAWEPYPPDGLTPTRTGPRPRPVFVFPNRGTRVRVLSLPMFGLEARPRRGAAARPVAERRGPYLVEAAAGRS